jgi:glucan endo-1,3-alpha-glucosidase
MPPGSADWTNGFDHTVRSMTLPTAGQNLTRMYPQGWLKITSFLAEGFKTGAFPTPSKDELVLWARPHPAAAKASADPMSPPTNAQFVRRFTL